MAKLGYTWYAKDWRSNMDVSELTLQEKGFYRELIDECFLKNTSKIQLNERTFCRLHGINSRTFTKVLQKLHDSFLIVIENFDETIISIPSTTKRLGVIEKAVKGGKSSVKNSVKKIAKSKEKEKEKEKVEYTIPSFTDFKKHSDSKGLDVNYTKLKLKYDSWVENNWKDGNGNKIVNWKSKLTNTLNYLLNEKQKPDNNTPKKMTRTW